MEYTEQEKIVNADDGEGGWVDTHPSNDILNEENMTAQMHNEEKVLLRQLIKKIWNYLHFIFYILLLQSDSEIMCGKLEQSLDGMNFDDDEGEAAAMEDSDLEDEADEVFKLYSKSNLSMNQFKINFCQYFRLKWKLYLSVKAHPKYLKLVGK